MLDNKAADHDLALNELGLPHVKEHTSICLNSHLLGITVLTM